MRGVLIGMGVGLWFWTQQLIGSRGLPADRAIGDGLLDLTAAAHQFLAAHPAWADALLIASSLLIDLMATGLLIWSLVGPSIRPFLGLLMLFLLRQACQAACALPAPPGMIWRHPGIPSLWVTYDVGNDFYFSGHTALAVYASVELARLNWRRFAAPAAAIAAFQVAVVIVLRAHWTMDVFAGAVAALWIAIVAARLAPAADRLIAAACGGRAAGR